MLSWRRSLSSCETRGKRGAPRRPGHYSRRCAGWGSLRLGYFLWGFIFWRGCFGRSPAGQEPGAVLPNAELWICYRAKESAVLRNGGRRIEGGRNPPKNPRKRPPETLRAVWVQDCAPHTLRGVKSFRVSSRLSQGRYSPGGLLPPPVKFTERTAQIRWMLNVYGHRRVKCVT